MSKLNPPALPDDSLAPSPERKQSPLVVSFGGGVNSAAMLIGMQERCIRPDVVLFADTGGEKPETYQFVDLMSKWLEANSMPPVTTVRNDGKYESLEAECLSRKTLPPIVMGWRTCSDKYKHRPAMKWLKANGFLDSPIQMAIGFDADEGGRAGDFDTDKLKNRYFLIEWNWRRADCVLAIQRASLPVPVKSACFFCPSSKPREVLWLNKHHSDLMQRSLEMERNAEGLMVSGLGRHWSWAQVIKADADQFKMFPESVDIPCMCFDGDAE